ncbi:MAG: hypothetical protein ACR2RF_24800 [Geminicoccaceae bacterium]
MLRLVILAGALALTAGFTIFGLPAWEAQRWTKSAREDIRSEIIQGIWNRRKLPKVLPRREGNKLIVDLPWGFVSRSTILYPKRWNGDFVISHAGHDPLGWKQRPGSIKKFLKAGYRVIAMDMPLTGDNSWPPHLRFPEHTNHNKLASLEGQRRSPLELFLTPVAAVTNFITEEFPGSRIHMTGVSGGGWTTTVICGLDPRIEVCSSVAGDNPYAGSGGDYEQIHPALIDNYLDLYVLAACSGKKLHVVHRGDPWFLPSVARTYEKAVKRVVRKCKGKFQVRATNLGKHGYGRKAARIFLKAL